jgi:hypothetical protein
MWVVIISLSGLTAPVECVYSNVASGMECVSGHLLWLWKNVCRYISHNQSVYPCCTTDHFRPLGNPTVSRNPTVLLASRNLTQSTSISEPNLVLGNLWRTKLITNSRSLRCSCTSAQLWTLPWCIWAHVQTQHFHQLLNIKFSQLIFLISPAFYIFLQYLTKKKERRLLNAECCGGVCYAKPHASNPVQVNSGWLERHVLSKVEQASLEPLRNSSSSHSPEWPLKII